MLSSWPSKSAPAQCVILRLWSICHEMTTGGHDFSNCGRRHQFRLPRMDPPDSLRPSFLTQGDNSHLGRHTGRRDKGV